MHSHTSRGIVTRRKILRAAGRRFSRAGYEATSLGDVAKAGEIASSILITPHPWRRCHLIDWEVQRQQWWCPVQVSHCVRSG